ncbi:GNAT family N-acetyltransferase [Arthrobacter sp. D1-17]
MTALRWSREVPLEGLVLRQATPADAQDLATLMGEPDVEQWWHQAWEPEKWAAYIAGLVQDPDSLPLTLADNVPDGQTVGYVEVYRVATDTLGRHIAHSPTDLGMHLALGELARGRGLGTHLIRSVLDAAPAILEGCGRLVAEPDTRNTRSHRAFEAAGFAAAGTVQLPDKSALLVVAAPNAVSIQETASIQAAGSLQQAVSPHHMNEGVLL